MVYSLKKLHAALICAFVMFLTLCDTSNAQVYNQFECGGDLTGNGCTWNNQVIGNGAVTLAKQANLSADTLQCNPTSASTAPQACPPIAAANLMSAVFSVTAVSIGNITLSGTQTLDGQSLAQGQSVLVSSQSTNSQNGIYIVQSGAWTRAINFPAGYVLPQNCDVAVFVRQGTINQGHTYKLSTNGGLITIGTTSQNWTDAVLASATSTNAGLVKVTSGTSAVLNQAVLLGQSTVTNIIDCVEFGDSNTGVSGSIGDFGNTAGTVGPCIVGDANGHPILNGTGSAPSVTGTGCSLTAGGRDNTGSIVATGLDTCTLAFGGAFTTAPNCTVANVGTTVLATLTALPTTAHAIFATAAAGTFMYHCL